MPRSDTRHDPAAPAAEESRANGWRALLARRPFGGAARDDSLVTPLGMTMIAVAAWSVTAISEPRGLTTLLIGQLLLSLALILLLSATHELGHLAAGRLAGLDLRSFTVGPLAFVRWRRRYRLTANAHWIRFAGCVQHDIRPGLTTRESLAASVLGGPVANFVLGALLVSLGGHVPLMRDVALWSVFFGAINLVPLRTNGQTSDGGLLLRLWSRNPRDVEWRKTLMAQG